MVKIILEGPDNSGKSTLASYLSEALRIPLVPGEGPAKSEKEIDDRVRRYLNMPGPLIFDRHPCVSQPIYNHFRSPIDIEPELISAFYEDEVYLIYCPGRPTLEGHQVKDHDRIVNANGQKHEDLVNQFHPQICAHYLEWGINHANLVYRIGDNMGLVANAIKAITDDFDPVRDIVEFHRKYGLGYDGPPRVLPQELGAFRKRFMDEELEEYNKHEAQAYLHRYVDFHKDAAGYAHELGEMLDALVDEVYVVLGTAYLHGFNFREAWRRVHRANMSKKRAERATDSKRSSVYDVIKPEGWEAPTHIDLVENHDMITK